MCRNIRYIVLLFLLPFALLFACQRHDTDLVETRRATSRMEQVVEPAVAERSRSIETPSQELVIIDSLMWHQPDSALARLLPYFDTCCRDVACNVYSENHNSNSEDVARYVSTNETFDNHYANLLLAELLYKNDYAQINRPALLQAVAYFDSLVRKVPLPPLKGGARRAGDSKKTSNPNTNLAFLDARAHYINGVGFYENDSMVDACKEYIMTLEVMENYNKGKELVGHKAQFIALTYTRLTDLFSDLYLHEQAIYFAQKSLASSQQLDVPRLHIARMLCEIGIQYDMLEQLDSADYYYSSAMKVLNDSNCLLFRDISTRQILLSYKKGGIEENTLSQLHHIMSHSNGEMEYLLRCSSVGEVFYYEKQLDSAWYYLVNVYYNTDKIAVKKQVAEWLLDISKTQGRNDEILEYADFLAPFANQEENQSEVKSQLTELYNAYRQANLSRQHQRMVKKNTTIGLVIVGGLFVVLLAYVLLYHKNRRRKQLLEKQIKEEQLSHDMKQKALSGRLKQSNQKLQETLKWIENQKAGHNTTENTISYVAFDERYEAFRQSQICLEIHNAVNNLHNNKRDTLKTNVDVTGYKAFALTLSQTAQLTKTVEMFFPNLYTALKTQYAALDRKEWLHCCLYLLQLDKMSICVLLQEQYYTCRRCTLKLEKAFDCRQGLPAFILEQAKSC